MRISSEESSNSGDQLESANEEIQSEKSDGDSSEDDSDADLPLQRRVGFLPEEIGFFRTFGRNWKKGGFSHFLPFLPEETGKKVEETPKCQLGTIIKFAVKGFLCILIQ